MSEQEAEEKGVDFEQQDGEEDELTHEVPEKYNVPSESGIKVTVKAGDNNIPIALTSDTE